MQVKVTNKTGELLQKTWIDHVNRKSLISGELIKLINTFGITGASFDLAAYKDALFNNKDYNEDIVTYSTTGLSSEDIYKAISIEDIRTAAEIFESIYKKSGGIDGYVTLGISPALAYDANNAIIQVKELWSAVDRRNVMIQILATKQSLPIIQECIKEGININIASIYGLTRYKEVAEAFISGLKDRLELNKPIDNIFSVVTFLTFRIDELTDPLLESRKLSQLKGRVGTATAMKAYKIFSGIFLSEQFKQLEAKGANKQQIVLVNSAINGPDHASEFHHIFNKTDTILSISNTHKKPNNESEYILPKFDQAVASQVLSELDNSGIDINIITQKLEDLDIRKLNNDYKGILNNIQANSYTSYLQKFNA